MKKSFFSVICSESPVEITMFRFDVLHKHAGDVSAIQRKCVEQTIKIKVVFLPLFSLSFCLFVQLCEEKNHQGYCSFVYIKSVACIVDHLSFYHSIIRVYSEFNSFFLITVKTTCLITMR